MASGHKPQSAMILIRRAASLSARLAGQGGRALARGAAALARAAQTRTGRAALSGAGIVAIIGGLALLDGLARPPSSEHRAHAPLPLRAEDLLIARVGEDFFYLSDLERAARV
ncbi:MAG: hypothetical protein AAGC95_15700, partial [Pseudomonadota bacterium]